MSRNLWFLFASWFTARNDFNSTIIGGFMFQYLSRALLSVLFVVSTSTAFAFPLPKIHMAQKDLPKDFTADHHFDGIVALDNCSGSIVKFEGTKDTDQAMVLTNGHCYEGGFSDPGQFVLHAPSSRTFTVLDDSAQDNGTVNATEVIYSTMTGTDITLYKLAETYVDILKNTGAHAMTLSSKHPSEQTPMEVISGYWRRGYSCHIQAFVTQLNEDKWSFTDSIRYSRPGCETIGGTSGSPIVEDGTRTVIGINNTGNESGEKCTMNNPCEVDKQGNITYERGVSYGQQTYIIYSCLNPNMELDLATPGCLLAH
jgi:V8-like Glu-specific endopeptidase